RGQARAGGPAVLDPAAEADDESGRRGRGPSRARHRQQRRSEEHTSELQSLAYLVCRLLLEKKKKNKQKRVSKKAKSVVTFRASFIRDPLLVVRPHFAISVMAAQESASIRWTIKQHFGSVCL